MFGGYSREIWELIEISEVGICKSSHLFLKVKIFNVKIARLSPCFHTKKQTCLKGEAAICGARLILVSRQFGAHLWREGPAGGLSGIQTHNLLALACLEVHALPLSYLLLQLLLPVYLLLLALLINNNDQLSPWPGIEPISWLVLPPLTGLVGDSVADVNLKGLRLSNAISLLGRLLAELISDALLSEPISSSPGDDAGSKNDGEGAMSDIASQWMR